MSNKTIFNIYPPQLDGTTPFVSEDPHKVITFLEGEKKEAEKTNQDFAIYLNSESEEISIEEARDALIVGESPFFLISIGGDISWHVEIATYL